MLCCCAWQRTCACVAAFRLMQHPWRRANGSIMRELEEGALPHFKQHDGLQICHALLLTAVPLMRATGCPEITYADTIQHFGAPATARAHALASITLLQSRACTRACMCVLLSQQSAACSL